MTNAPHATTTPSAYSQPPAPGAGTLAVLAVAWLLAMLSSARHTIGPDPEAGDRVLAQVAEALPAVISASLLAGAGVGLAGVNLLARFAPGTADRTAAAYGAGAGAGALAGLAAAGPVVAAYAGLPSIVVLGSAVAVATTVGGLLAGVRHRVVVAAGVSGALGVFVAGFAAMFAVGAFHGDLQDLFGAGDTMESVATANAWVRLTASLLTGLAAGVIGYAYLRRCAPRELRWPAYLLAGAMPGLLALLAEAITRLGGARLFHLVGAASADDRAQLSFLNATRFNRALIVLFVGALVTTYLFGRTLRPARQPEPAEPAEPAEAGTDPDRAGAGS